MKLPFGNFLGGLASRRDEVKRRCRMQLRAIRGTGAAGAVGAGVDRLEPAVGPGRHYDRIVALGTADELELFVQQGRDQARRGRVVAADAYGAGAVAARLALGRARHHVVVHLEQGAPVDRLGHGALAGRQVQPQPFRTGLRFDGGGADRCLAQEFPVFVGGWAARVGG